MNRFVLATLLLGSPAALAQSTSDLMPALPAAPAGSSGVYYPGMPVPRAAAVAPGNAGTGTVSRGGVAPAGGVERNAPDTGRRGYDIYDAPTTSSYRSDPEPRVESDQMPETHVVRRGDTLWDIAGYYFRNPWTWPKLWALNPSITNPHWIYPGDVIRLHKEGPQQATAQAAAPTPGRIPVPVRTEGVFLRQTGFIEPEELKRASTIIGSKEEKILLSTLDEAYAELNKEHPLRVGERYSIYKVLKDVKHPVTHRKVGALVQIFSEAEVKTVTDGKMARVKIVDATDPIERGYKIGPLRRQFKIVEPVHNTTEKEGVVLTNLRPLNLVAADQLTFVDMGKAEGITLGNRLFITRRGDGYQGLLGTKPIDDPKYPREIVGEILVIDTRDHISTGLVTRSSVDSRIGDRVEARKGY